MAQILNNKAIHMDMTPLVDLAFLLLTFFILTATFNRPSTISLTFPPITDLNEIGKINGMTIFIKGDKINYVIGSTTNKNNPIHTTSNLVNDLACIKKDFDKRNDQLNVVVKPDDKASYQKVINVIDALNINDISAYSIQDDK